MSGVQVLQGALSTKNEPEINVAVVIITAIIVDFGYNLFYLQLAGIATVQTVKIEINLES